MVRINNIENLKQHLAQKLYNSCQKSCELIKEVTPIDTQRLFETVRATDPIIENNTIKVNIVLGGERLYGIRRETTIERDVNYAVYVEARYGFVRSCLNDIENTIKDEFK